MGCDGITRRGFLRNTAAAMAAAPYVIHSAALGNSEIPPASERITLGHIGVGGRGTAVQEQFQELKDAQCVAVCDPSGTRRDARAGAINEYYTAERGAGSYKACTAYNDFRELLAREDIDGVVIATPDHWHVPIALAAVRAGKDVYVEKPLGVSIAHDQAIRSAVKRYGAVFQYGTQQRSEEGFRHACELVRNGRIGKVQSVDVWCAPGGSGGSTSVIPLPSDLDYDLWLGPAPHSPYTSDRCLARGVYWISDYSLGFIAGWGVHPLDIAQWGLGMDHTSPVEYEGTGVIPSDGLFDTISTWDMHCRYKNGVTIHFMSSDIAQPIVERYRPFHDHGTTFFGSEGWVSVDRSGVCSNPASLVDSVIGTHETHLYESDDHRQNFIDCIKSRAKTICPVDQAVRVDTISQLCNIAVRLNRKVRWDPARERILNDSDADRMMSRPMRSPWTL